MGNNHDKFFSKQKRKLLVIGFQGSGKSSKKWDLHIIALVYTLSQGSHTDLKSDLQIVDIKLKNITLCVFDMGGSDRQRIFWRQNFYGSQGVIYMIDSGVDVTKSLLELERVVSDSDLNETPIAIFMNKIGADNKTQSVKEFVEELITKYPKKKLCVFEGSSQQFDSIMKYESNMINLKNKKIETDEHYLTEATLMLLKMNQDTHTKEQLYFILSRLEELSFFNQFIEQQLKGTQRNDVLDLCSRLRIEYFKGGEVIFEENAPSNDKLYIILYGSVILMRHRKMDALQQVIQQEPEKLKLTQIINAKKFTSKLLIKSRETAILSQNEKTNLISKYGDILRILRRGEGFGDKAIRENVPRSLTIAAHSQELFLVVLKKEDFLQFQYSFEHQIKDKQKLMFAVFKNVKNEYSTARLESMIYSCQTVQYERGAFLTIQEEMGDVFYIIQSGDITLYKKENNRMHPLCIVSSGHLLGEEIVINKKGIYEYSAQVSSLQCKVMVIYGHQFHSTFPEECRRQIIKDYRCKFQNRNHLFSHLNQSQMEQKLLQRYSSVPEGKFHKISIEEPFYVRHKEDIRSSFDMSMPSIQQIVDNEIKRSRQIQEQEKYHPQSSKNEMMAFDFGTNTQDQMKRAQHLFESKLNWRKPPQNFLKPKQKVLQLAIRQDLIKTFRKSRRAQVVSSMDLGITAYNTSKKSHFHTQID